MEPLIRFADGQERVVRDGAAVGDVVIHVRPGRHPKEEEGKQLAFQAMGKDCWRIENGIAYGINTLTMSPVSVTI